MPVWKTKTFCTPVCSQVSLYFITTISSLLLLFYNLLLLSDLLIRIVPVLFRRLSHHWFYQKERLIRRKYVVISFIYSCMFLFELSFSDWFTNAFSKNQIHGIQFSYSYQYILKFVSVLVSPYVLLIAVFIW